MVTSGVEIATQHYTYIHICSIWILRLLSQSIHKVKCIISCVKISPLSILGNLLFLLLLLLFWYCHWSIDTDTLRVKLTCISFCNVIPIVNNIYDILYNCPKQVKCAKSNKSQQKYVLSITFSQNIRLEYVQCYHSQLDIIFANTVVNRYAAFDLWTFIWEIAIYSGLYRLIPVYQIARTSVQKSKSFTENK